MLIALRLFVMGAWWVQVQLLKYPFETHHMPHVVGFGYIMSFSSSELPMY